MKTLTTALAIGLLAGVSAPAIAQYKDDKLNAEVVERNDRGQATKVSVDGTVYGVCTPEQQDNCINPREAGLNFGNVPLDYWPGQPASEMDDTDD